MTDDIIIYNDTLLTEEDFSDPGPAKHISLYKGGEMVTKEEAKRLTMKAIVAEWEATIERQKQEIERLEVLLGETRKKLRTAELARKDDLAQQGEVKGEAATPAQQGEGEGPPLEADPERIHLSGSDHSQEAPTGFFVRAMYKGKWDTFDLAALKEESARQWLEHWSKAVLVNIALTLLGHMVVIWKGVDD
jgi:hypothetical protein